jgi:hypothetical protein
VLSSFGDDGKPSWDGYWTKVKTFQLVDGAFGGRHRAFIFGIDDATGYNQIFEITPRKISDFDGPINWEVVSRSFDFESPFNEKRLLTGDVWLGDIKTDNIAVNVAYRQDENPDWIDWHTLQPVGPQGDCGEITCGGCPTIKPGFAPRKRFPAPPKDCDENTKRDSSRGFEFQARLRGAGHLSIRKFRLHAKNLPEDSKGACD